MKNPVLKFGFRGNGTVQNPHSIRITKKNWSQNQNSTRHDERNTQCDELMSIVFQIPGEDFSWWDWNTTKKSHFFKSFKISFKSKIDVLQKQSP